jgi:hypothetical protein
LSQPEAETLRSVLQTDVELAARLIEADDGVTVLEQEGTR